MAIKEAPASLRIDEAVASGQTAMDESRFEEAANHFRSALRLGSRSSDEEAQIRCLLSVALEKRGLNPEQLDAVSKYEKPADLARLSAAPRMSVLIRTVWGDCTTNDPH